MPTKHKLANMFLPFIESKTLDETKGTFEGYLSVKNNVDLGNDRVRDGAFTKTIQSWNARFAQQKWMPFLWQHDAGQPIGGITELREDPRGLYIKGFFDLDTQRGREAYSGFSKGYLSGLSMGYETIKQTYDKDIRDLLEVKLWEGSAATFPMNTEAEVTQVKSASGSGDLPLAPRDRAWDASAAHKRVLAYAGGKDNLDAEKFAEAYMIAPDDKTDVSEYKLGFADVIDGKLVAVPKGIFAVAGVLQGARGGVDASDDDKAHAKAMCDTYYAKMRKEFDDDSIKAPWDESGKGVTPVEGKGLSLEDRLERIWQAVRSLGVVCDPDGWTYSRYWVCDTFDDHVIIEDNQTDQLYQVSYELADDGSVTLGDRVPVEIQYTPTQKARMRRQATKRLAFAFGPETIKAGRRNSASDKTLLTKAFEAITGLMEPAHQKDAMQQLFGSLDASSRADLLSALKDMEPDDDDTPAPDASAKARHTGPSTAHSKTGAAATTADEAELQQLASKTLDALRAAAQTPPVKVVESPATEALAMLRKAAGQN